MLYYFIGAVIITSAYSLILFITLALLSRRAIRGVWKDHELWKQSLVDFQNKSFDRYRKLYGEFAGLYLKRESGSF